MLGELIAEDNAVGVVGLLSQQRARSRFLETVPSLLGQVSQHRRDADFDRLARVGDLLAAEEIMLIDRGPARQPLGTPNEVEGLADRRLPGVVAGDEERVPPLKLTVLLRDVHHS